MFNFRMGMEILLPSISINDKIFLCKTLNFSKSPTRTLTTIKPQFSRSAKFRPTSAPFSRGKTISNKEITLQFDNYNRNRNLKRILFEKLKDEDSDPVQILEEDGDWGQELFWAVVGFLNQTSRSNHVLKVFDKWSSKDKSRISIFNYERIIRLMAEEGAVEAAVSALKDMNSIHIMQASLEIYDSIVHGFIEKGRLEDALFHLNEMEYNEMKPLTSTYNVLIKAYAKDGLYDDMAKCVKKMESNGCFPDDSTYNLLIREFSQAGLVKRMERTYRIVISKKLDLEASTMVAMLDAYAKFGILDQMEKIYRKLLKLKLQIYLNDDLVREVANVYIENYMFSRLDDMGINLDSKTRNTDIIWCLRMLSHACVLSRTGMGSVVREMDDKKVKWSVTIANIMLFAYAKMKDFGDFKVVLKQMAARNVKPDIVTCGVVFDAVGESDYLKKMGFLRDVVGFKTDPLVLVAFGKGGFLKIVEDLDVAKTKGLTYEQLIKLVIQHRQKYG